MTINGSRRAFRCGVMTVLAVAVLAGCNDGGFDVSEFANQAASEGAMTKDQARCVAKYIDKYGSDRAKDELQKLTEEDGADPVSPSDDPELAEEVTDLMVAAGQACLPLVTTP